MTTKGDRLWGGGYEEATHPLVARMNASRLISAVDYLKVQQPAIFT